MSYTLLSESYPVARKQHKCIWCGEKIIAGEKYRREKSVYDGNMQDHKWHLECHDDCHNQSLYDEEFTAYGNERPKTPN